MTVLALTAGNGRAQFPVARVAWTPRKYSEHPNILSAATIRPQAARLTSPHQNVRWQNRKAAVCSCHLKVHLHTLFQQSPSALISARAEGVGYRDQCLAQHTCGFQLLLFSDCVCLVAFLNLKNKISQDTTFHPSFSRSQRSAKSRGWPLRRSLTAWWWRCLPPDSHRCHADSQTPTTTPVSDWSLKAGDTTVPVAMVSLQHKVFGFIWLLVTFQKHTARQDTGHARWAKRAYLSLKINSCGWFVFT